METEKYNAIAADFETNNYESDCYVWSWGAEDLDTCEYKSGKTIESFFTYLTSAKSTKVYFHNLKFDGVFILDWLLKKGYKHSTKRYPGWREFTTLIGSMGEFYTITVRMGGKARQIIDSLKIINSPLRAFPKMFGLDIEKGEIDYNKFHPKGYEPTEKEASYQMRDVKLLATGLKYILGQGMTRITAASNAYGYLKTTWGDTFKRNFPVISEDCDEFCRKAYRGGYVIVGPAAKGDVGAGIVLDENSMYPDKMRNALLPYSDPVQFTGNYEYDEYYPLYIIKIRCAFHVKQGYLPTVQLKHTLGFNPVEYVESTTNSNGEMEIVELTLTNVDYELFIEHYEMDSEIEYLGGYKFKARKGLLKEYVDYWYEVKERATAEGNAGMRTLSKLMLNSCYGKFGKRRKTFSKIPYLNEDKVSYMAGDMENQDGEYLPVACFITAWSRNDVIRKGQANYSRLLYIDTDSLHLLGEELPKGIRMDPVKLGAWDLEMRFNRARYLRPKCYIEDTDKGLNVKCAGLPEGAKSGVTWENFHLGAKYEGKLMRKTVPGGVILTETTFKIKVDF